MRFTSCLLLTATAALTACQGGDDPSNNSTAPADFIFRATSDIQTPSPVTAASFVPNSVASWLGHIILLDAKGTLHRATTDSAETEIVALGRYVDVAGLAREKKAGVFLALTPQGQIKGFIQSDDEGNFSPLAVSQPSESFERFCVTAKPNETVLWAQSSSKSHKLSVEVFDENSVSLSVLEKGADDIDPCKAKPGFSLGADHTLSAANNALTLTAGGKPLSVELTNGLSIGGRSELGYVTGTDANMGSVFNEGLILAADKNDGRLVLISRSYVLQELEAR